MKLITILISVLLGALGQIFVKMGAGNIDFKFEGIKIFSLFVNILRNIPIMIGIILYLISFIIWIKVLSEVDLSYAYPMVSLGYVFVLIISHFLFNENISIMKIVGIIFIVVGVIFISTQ